MQIKEVAERAGIPDPHYFNKQFKRIVGIPPTEYQRIQAMRNLTNYPDFVATMDCAQR